jgi:hypothetical protein
MPKGYEEIRDRLIDQNMPVKEAKMHAARIWNAQHPENPVTRHSDKAPDKHQGKKTKR